MNNKEIWKDVKGYEGIYQVSSSGELKSLKRKGRLKDKALSLPTNNGGYVVVDLCKQSKKETCSVHQLVAIAFLNHTPCGHKLVVDHINNDKTDNRFENLQLITQRENASKDRKGKSKHTGVSKAYIGDKWVAEIQTGNKKKYLGTFNCEIDASNAYKEALKHLI